MGRTQKGCFPVKKQKADVEWLMRLVVRHQNRLETGGTTSTGATRSARSKKKIRDRNKQLYALSTD
jgi:hypothetical protein